MRMKLLPAVLLSVTLMLTACSASEDSLTALSSTTDYLGDNSTSESGSSTEMPSSESSEKSDSSSVSITEYSVGDIALNSGSVIKADMLAEQDIPVAVVAGKNNNGTFFAVGIHRSEQPLQWSDGTDFPALDFADNYAENHGLSGDLIVNWRMPDISELQIIYDNREIINKTLEAIHKSIPASMDSLSTTWYWSSSQSESQADYAWFVHFHNGYAGECPKDFTNVNVIAVCELGRT